MPPRRKRTRDGRSWTQDGRGLKWSGIYFDRTSIRIPSSSACCGQRGSISNAPGGCWKAAGLIRGPAGRKRSWRGNGSCASRDDGRTALSKILRRQLDRRAVRRAVGGAVPGLVVARELARASDALRRDEPFERVEPVMIVGLAGVGIAGGLGTLDLAAKRGCSFRPGEHAARVQRERHGEGLRLP